MRSLAFISLLALLQGCTTTENPLYCDTAHPCDDNGFCDIDGEFGPSNRCVRSSGECTPGAAEQCTEDADTPVCDPRSFCRHCTNSDECPNDGICDLTTGRCEAVTCTQDQNDCPAGAPSCNEDTNMCQECVPGPAGDADCARHDPLLYCVSGSCAQCRDTVDCAGGQVCDEATHQCTDCTNDAQCLSGICDLAAGRCFADADILFVDATDPAGNATGECTREAPCTDLDWPMDLVTNQGDPRVAMMVLGGEGTTYQGSYPIQKTFTIIGHGETVMNDTPDTAVFTVSGADTDVRMDSLVLAGSTGMNVGHGIRCETGASLRLERMELRSNEGNGLNSNACDLVTIQRSLVAQNNQGGLSITESAFEIRNNFIVDNGNFTTGTIGGALFANSAQLSPQTFDFNTVVGNAVMVGIAYGVRCNVNSPITAATGNLIYTGSSAVAVSGDCTYKHSNIQGTNTNGTTNIDAPPAFVNSGALDYHLVEGSGGIDIMDWTSELCVGENTCVDIDGEVRPLGDGFDIGADEFTPTSP